MTLRMLHQSITEFDPELFLLIKEEEKRQTENLELIASENFTSLSVLQANASILTNKYSEGYPKQRYYGGTDVIDKIEILCQKRALEAFNLNSDIWGVNVQSLSGSPANFAVYTALIGPNGKLMGLDLPSGGHLTHGFQTKSKKVSASSLYFQSSPYKLGPDNLLNYDLIKSEYEKFKPDILICGASAYPRDFDYEKLRNICDLNETYLMADISHISGLIIAKEMNNPFEFCDVVTTTTHKTLRGPRAALIFYRKHKTVKGIQIDIENKINFAVFPMLQGGPHNQTIAAIAVALKQANTEEYRDYIRKVKNNAQCMAEQLTLMGYDILTGGTDCHLILVDVTNTQLTGNMVEKVCELASITLNKNALPGSKSTLNPFGVRLGSSALTTRGFSNDDFIKVCIFFDKAVKIGQRILKKNLNDSNISKFIQLCEDDLELISLRKEVITFASKFPLPVMEYN